jgi:hypothetical protein
VRRIGEAKYVASPPPPPGGGGPKPLIFSVESVPSAKVERI